MIQLNNSPHPVISMPRVRVAGVDDYDEIMAMCCEAHTENGLHDFAADKIAFAIAAALNGDGAFIGVVGPVGALEGMIYLGVRMLWYTSKPHLEEQVSYVRPAFRKTRNAVALIDYAKNCALQLNLPLLIGVLSTKRTEGKIGLYKRKLGKPSGAYFFYNGTLGD
jgi:hypothetical protein